MQPSNSTLCYEATQRIYRNAVVKHIRTVLTAKYPDNWKKQLVHVVGADEWNKNETNVRQRKVSGELRTKLTDDFDLLDVSHFYNLFDKFFSDLFLAKPDESSKDATRRKRAILDWTHTVKTLRDPMSHPSEEDFTYQDAFRMIDCACRVLEALELPESLQLQNIIQDISAGQRKDQAEPTEPLLHSLPPREAVVVDFVGRSEELTCLWAWLNDPLSKRWTLAGEGGKGKSAIAYEFATSVRFAAPPGLEVVWWLSAKKKRFTERRPTQITDPDFEDLSSACNKLLADYGRVDLIGDDLERKKESLLKLLDEVPGLLVVDDVDSLEAEDEAALEFFTLSAPATKSKVLLTTRRTVFGMAHTTTHVSGMNDLDFTKFLVSRCKMFGLDPKTLSPKAIIEVAALTENSPLYAEDLLRLAASVSLGEAIKGWRDKEGEEARKYALGRELDMLSSEAREALLCACLHPGPLSFSELESLTGFSKKRLQTAISEMQRLFLVPKPRIIEQEERFDVNVNTRALVVKVLEGSEVFRRSKSAVDAVRGRLPYADRGRTGAVIRQAVFLVKANELLKAEETIRTALAQEPNNSDLIGALGYVYKCWKPKRSTDARQKFERAAQLKCRRLDPYRHWIQLEISEREWTNAFRAAELGMKNLPNSVELLYWAGHAHSRLGRELSSGLVLEKARLELEIAKDLLDRALRPPEILGASQERQLNSTCYRAIVLNYEALIDLSALEKIRGLRRLVSDGSRADDLRKMAKALAEWYAEHPDDPLAESELVRIEKKYGITVG